MNRRLRWLVLSALVAGAASSAGAGDPYAVYLDGDGVIVGTVLGDDRVLVEFEDGVLAEADVDLGNGWYEPLPLDPEDVFYLNVFCNSPRVRSTAVGAGRLVAVGEDWGVTGDAASPVPIGAFVTQRNQSNQCVSVGPPQGLMLYEIDAIPVQQGFAPPVTVEIRLAGDENGDGVVDIVDVAVLRRRLAGLPVN